jgi:hypothetical protein
MSSLPQLNTPLLRSRLKLKSLQSSSLLSAHHPHVVQKLHVSGILPGRIREHATRLLASGAAAAALMLSPQALPVQAALPAASPQVTISPLDVHNSLVEQLRQILPPTVEPLDSSSESKISGILHNLLGIHATAELEGNRLNTSYGLIGAEQHLPRYPGDSVDQHDNFQESGITPGRGAWGYFANSKDDLSESLKNIEKYYVAVQTLYLPDWSARLPYLRDWYKYRKVLVVNPHNGRVVVAAIADSGPSVWTGKQFGGSPEVMHYLERRDGRERGPVLLLFIDDPQNQIPLGPLEYNLEHPPSLVPG